MGQQQLLLIVLSVIVVGIAIVVGINLFSANAVESNRNSVIADLHHIAHLAQAYYKRPTAFGGGGNSFVGFTIPATIATNAHGTFTVATAGTATQIVLQGVGVELGDDGAAGVRYQMTVQYNQVPTVTKQN
ncbi:MAG: hypothetical protein LWX56_05385 [Ignavibacteria bacterium]|nr:hypothetical protein [Ignavibacteria bacterium]